MAPPSSVIRPACLLGLWGVATWLVLSLHDAPIAQEHSICGPWGCGPTIPALLSAHGFWLLVAIPGALWLAGSIPIERTTVVGWACLLMAVVGIAVVMIAGLMNGPGATRPGERFYVTERMLFSLATTVDVPLVPGVFAGMILLNAGRRRRRDLAPDGPASPEDVGDGCVDDRCGRLGSLDVAQVPGRIEVGERLPELTLYARDGKAFVVPAVAGGRASILYFMRDASCSICRKHVRALVRMSETPRLLGADVLIIQPGGVEASRALARSLSAQLAIASGLDSGAYDAIGLRARGFGALQGSGTLLVDRHGLVRHARLASLPFAAFSESELFDACQYLRNEQIEALAGPPVVGLNLDAS